MIAIEENQSLKRKNEEKVLKEQKKNELVTPLYQLIPLHYRDSHQGEPKSQKIKKMRTQYQKK